MTADPAAIPYPLPPADLRAVCARLFGGPDGHPDGHGTLAPAARALGIPYRTFVNYAAGARPVPRHVVHALRALCALQQITKEIPQ